MKYLVKVGILPRSVKTEAVPEWHVAVRISIRAGCDEILQCLMNEPHRVSVGIPRLAVS